MMTNTICLFKPKLEFFLLFRKSNQNTFVFFFLFFPPSFRFSPLLAFDVRILVRVRASGGLCKWILDPNPCVRIQKWFRDKGLMGIRYTGEGIHIQSRGGGSHGACRMRIIYCNSLPYAFSPCHVPLQSHFPPFQISLLWMQPSILASFRTISMLPTHFNSTLTWLHPKLFTITCKTPSGVYYDTLFLDSLLPSPSPRFSVPTNNLANFPEIDFQMFPVFSDYFRGSRHLAREAQYGNLHLEEEE